MGNQFHLYNGGILDQDNSPYEERDHQDLLSAPDVYAELKSYESIRASGDAVSDAHELDQMFCRGQNHDLISDKISALRYLVGMMQLHESALRSGTLPSLPSLLVPAVIDAFKRILAHYHIQSRTVEEFDRQDAPILRVGTS